MVKFAQQSYLVIDVGASLQLVLVKKRLTDVAFTRYSALEIVVLGG